MKPTARQLAALLFIVAYIEGHSFPPSLRDVADLLGLSSLHGVSKLLAQLEKKGLIYREAGKARAMVVTSSGADLCAKESA